MTVGQVDGVEVPMDLGADRRGVDMGPSAVPYARLHEALGRLGIASRDHGNIAVPVVEAVRQADATAKYLPTIEAVCERLAELVEEIVRDGRFPLVLGDDHSIAMGTLAGLTRARGRAPSVIWVDAHADANAPQSSPPGNVHGMPVHFAPGAANVASDRAASAAASCTTV